MIKALILFGAAVFVAYGLVFMFFPIDAFSIVTGSELATKSGIIDVRATYGGMSVAVGALMWVFSRNPSTYGIGLLSILVLMLSMALGRAIGFVAEGEANLIMQIYLALEVGAAILALILIRALRVRPN